MEAKQTVAKKTSPVAHSSSRSELAIMRTGFGHSTGESPIKILDLSFALSDASSLLSGPPDRIFAEINHPRGSSQRLVERRLSVAPTEVIIQMTKNMTAQIMLPTS
jgi:hypothetical protein